MRGLGGLVFINLRVTIGTPADNNVTFVVESSNGVIHMGTVTSDAPVRSSHDTTTNASDW